MTEHFYTMRISLGDTLCDPASNIIHTGRWTQWRHGTRGRWPNKIDFNTDCGKQIKAISHNCNHSFTQCEECKAKNGNTYEQV